MSENHILDLLKHIPVSSLTYQEWINVGMALKHEGFTASDWDSWSKDDPRYHVGECYRKWETFDGSSTPVTGGTVYQLAVEYGYEPIKSYDDGRGALEWDSEIKYDNGYQFIDKNWVDGKEFHEPRHWNPAQEMIRYLDTLFSSEDIIGYSTASYPKINDETGEIEKYLPQRGAYDRTAGQLIDQLTKCNGDIGAVMGDYDPNAGAWIRFNPLDGNGVKNENVTNYRYALVESDNMDLEKQNAIMRELELPIAVMVYSGAKSIHSIVKIEASNKDEYKRRVDYLYKICKKNGLNVDEQNKNPSRLSRLPGVTRNGNKQFIIDTNIGQATWDDWFQYIEDLNDDLPDPESLVDTFDNLPELAPELIRGVLRQGHKMLIAGPSKAGKSFALIEMCIAIAEGSQWLGWECIQGKVLYVNLELDRASCLHRFKDVYQSLRLAPNNVKNIDIWNLRGKTVPMDKLAPKLIRRASKKDYIAVIIDPIYKVLTGDENSADQMAHFTNQFDKVATELGCSVIYCHHHSKGAQGGKKSMDRASGSGVFARDPDALIDLVELEITEDLLKQQLDKARCEIYKEGIFSHNLKYYQNKIGLDDLKSASKMKEHANKALEAGHYNALHRQIQLSDQTISAQTAWRVEGTLREFMKFKPVNIWFNYPIHTVDDIGVLQDIQLEDVAPAWKRAISNRKSPEEKKEERKESFELAYGSLTDGIEPVKIEAISEFLGVSEKSVRRRVKEVGGYEIIDGKVQKID